MMGNQLIGRLLYDSKMIFEANSQLRQIAKVGAGQEIDFALLVDGLAAEREQGITVMSAGYVFFHRKA